MSLLNLLPNVRQGAAILSTCAAATLLLTLPNVASAHICMEQPLSRLGPDCGFNNAQKAGPCGSTQRSENVTVYAPGETIEIVVNEAIPHPSHYRVAFNPDGDDFEDPTSINDVYGNHPHVLLDNIEDIESGVFGDEQTIRVTLPNIACDNCTLQLIQVMHDKQGNGFGGSSAGNDDIYYSCADIVLRPGGDLGDETVLDDDGCSLGGDHPHRHAGWMAALGVGLLLTRRRFG